jgi:hypothetical protein
MLFKPFPIVPKERGLFLRACNRNAKIIIK